jgi:hypothetical protein
MYGGYASLFVRISIIFGRLQFYVLTKNLNFGERKEETESYVGKVSKKSGKSNLQDVIVNSECSYPCRRACSSETMEICKRDGLHRSTM